MKLAYADPPYIGCANRYKENKEVDHHMLLQQLKKYDGWALSCSSPSLGILLPMCPVGVRIAAWVKPFCSFKPNVNPAYAWEPVIFQPARKYPRKALTIRDWHSESITLRKNLVGAKPLSFCFWLFGLLGAKSEDTFDDLYPGTGAVTKAWQQWQTQSTLFLRQP